MANDIVTDVIEAILAFYTTLFGVEVNMKKSFKDPRLENESIRAYPEVTLSIVDVLPALSRQYGGIHWFKGAIYEDPQTKQVVDLTYPPNPLDMFFQLDSYCETMEQDWSILQSMMQLFGRQDPIVTTAESRTLYLVRQSFDPLDKFEANLFRKAYTFSTVIWLPDRKDVDTDYVILERDFDINSNNFNIKES